MKLRKRILKSKSLEWILSWFMASYLRFCHFTTSWNSSGLDDLEKALNDGPIILVSWHSRLMMSGLHWPKHWSRIKPIHDTAPAGRLAGGTMKQFGLEPIAISSSRSKFAITRLVLGEMGQGVSIGMAADGPEGPVGVCKPAPILWARASGRPVFVYAWSARRVWRLKTWDRLVFPRPFNRGTYSFRECNMQIPRKLDAETTDRLCAELADHLDQITDETDTKAGSKPI